MSNPLREELIRFEKLFVNYSKLLVACSYPVCFCSSMQA